MIKKNGTGNVETKEFGDSVSSSLSLQDTHTKYTSLLFHVELMQCALIINCFSQFFSFPKQKRKDV